MSRASRKERGLAVQLELGLNFRGEAAYHHQVHFEFRPEAHSSAEPGGSDHPQFRRRQGRAIIRGTRHPVAVVVGSLVGGMTFQDAQQEYDITADDIRAALKYFVESAPVRLRGV